VLSAVLLGAATVSAEEEFVREFNSPAHELVKDVYERGRLLTNTPQWAAQLLHWPPAGELQAHLAIRDDALAAEATAMAARVLQPDYLPDDLTDWWIPLRDWNVFYIDWVDHGGADAFLANFSVDETRFQVADTPNNVIVGIRPSTGRGPGLSSRQWVVDVARAFVSVDLHPIDLEDHALFRVLRRDESGEIVEGDWIPQGPERRTSAPDSALEIERVTYFSDSHVVVLAAPKFLWDPTSLANPFVDRFPVPESPAEVDALAQMLFRPESPTPQPVAADPARMMRVLEELLEATPSDVLMADWARRLNEIGVELTVDEVDRMFGGATVEEIGLWHAQQLAERLMAEGVLALAAHSYDEAANRFSQALVLDPLNISAAAMLELTRDRARAWALRIERPLPLPWFEAAEQALARHRNAVRERRYEMRERSEIFLALRDLRTQWLEAYGERDFRRARQILSRILELDPGDASTLFFIELIEGLIDVEEAAAAR
jgi:tetratricopeptide (TPR) repeat protein